MQNSIKKNHTPILCIYYTKESCRLFGCAKEEHLFVSNSIDLYLISDVQHICAVSPLGQHNGLLLLPFQTVTLRSFFRDWRREIILGTDRKEKRERKC